MAKVRRKEVMNSLQTAARLSRTALAQRLLAHGFYAGQEQVMLLLNDDDGLTPGQLAKRLGVRPPTVTKMVNRLQAQGYVSKRGSEQDARQANIFLTETGQSAIRAIEKAVRKTDRLAFDGFEKKERKALLSLLGRIEANLSGGLNPDMEEAGGAIIEDNNEAGPDSKFEEQA